MTLEWPIRQAHAASDAGDRLAQLREVLALVEQIAGYSPRLAEDAALDEGASLSSAYDDASPVVRKRFDSLAAEASAWAAAGVEALATASEAGVPKGAAKALADEIAKALRQLSAILAA